MAVKNKEKSNKKKFNIDKKKILKILLPVCIIGVIIYALYMIVQLIIVPTDMIVIENGTIFSEESAVGYVIRDEEVVKGKNYSNGMLQIKAEGEKVAKGDSIFRYYSENEETLNAKIEELNVEIQEAMLGRTGLFPGDIQAIDEQIDSKIDGLKSKNDMQEISEYKKDINTYITKKSEIAGDLSQAGTYINNLIKEREKYQSEIKENSEYVNAPISGVVSYRVDNLEDVLTPDNFENLNEKFLNELNLETGQIVTTSTEMGKVINNYECYIAAVLDSDEAKEAEVGQELKIRLSTQDEIDAEISYVSEQDNKSTLIVFRIWDCVEKLIDYRKISFDVIWWEYDGLKVPKSAIYYDNGLSYVVRSRGGYYDKILVEILKENNNYCIVDNYDNNELKDLGYSSEDISSMKKISIYDEIVISPDLSSLQ